METLIVALIDDNYVDRTIIKKLTKLIAPHIKTIEFSGAPEALQYFAEHAQQEAKLPDIVIIDINMPIMSGWEYLKIYGKLKADLSKQPRHYIYTTSIDPQELNYQHEDVYRTYTKPFDKKMIQEIID